MSNQDTPLTPREQRAKERNAGKVEAGVRYYVGGDNPSVVFPGVPLRDLSKEEFVALPEHLQRSVDDSDTYRKTKPPASQPATKKEA